MVIGGILTHSSATGADAGNSGDIQLGAPQGTATVKTRPVRALVTTTESDSDDTGRTGKTGNAGTITIQTHRLRLDQASIKAETPAGNGGNISIRDLSLLLLRRNSLISSAPLTEAQGITIPTNGSTFWTAQTTAHSSKIAKNVCASSDR